MTGDQKRLAHAYAQVFAATPQAQAVLDDLTMAANAMTDPAHRGGALLLILHIMVKRSAIRREKSREPKA